MTLLTTLILSCAALLPAQLTAAGEEPGSASIAATEAGTEAGTDDAAPAPVPDLDLPYGDLVVSDEEARLDVRAEPRLVWALLGEELADPRLDTLVVEAPVDRWQLLDELWLRVESLPYLDAGWTRVRVRSGSFESEADRLRAEDLLTALAVRLLDLEALKQTPLAPIAPAPSPAPAASAGGGAFATYPAPTTTYVPIWFPTWGIGTVNCIAPLVFVDTYSWAYGGYANYWPTYANACNSFGFGWGYGYSNFGYAYGGLGHYKHYYGGSYSLGFHHGYNIGFCHGYAWDPWYDVDVVVIVDDDDDDWDGWENGGDAGEDGLVPDEAGRGGLAQLRERKQLAAASDVDTDAARTRPGRDERGGDPGGMDTRGGDPGGMDTRGGDPGGMDTRGDTADRDDRAAGVVPVVRREVERRSPTRVVSVMPESSVAGRAPIVVRRTSERTGRPPTLRSSAVVDRVVRRSAPLASTPLVVGRPSLLPPSYGGGARTISASGVTRAGSPVSSAPTAVATSSRSSAPTVSTFVAPRSSAADVVSRVTSPSRARAPAPAPAPTYTPPSAPSVSPRTTSPRTSATRLFGSSSRSSSARSTSSRSSSSRSSASRSSSSSSRSSGRSSSRGSSSSSSSRGGRGGDR